MSRIRERFQNVGKPAIIAVGAGIIAMLFATFGFTYGLLNNSSLVLNTGVLASVNLGVYTTNRARPI